MTGVVVILLVVIGEHYSPANQMSATGPACRLLPAGQVHQALQTYGLSNLDNHEEEPVNERGTLANVCGYFGNELFGRNGYESARLYVATFSSVVQPQQVIGDLFTSWLGPDIAPYNIMPHSGTDDESWVCMWADTTAYPCFAAVRNSTQGIHLVVLFISGKFHVSDARPLASLVASVVAAE